MSTLQISLAVVGGLVLAGVVAHSAWSSRRNLPKQATPEAPPPEQEAAPAQDAEGAAERQEPSFDVDSGLASLASLTSMTPDRKPGLDVLIDAVAPVVVEGMVSGEAALAAMPSTR